MTNGSGPGSIPGQVMWGLLLVKAALWFFKSTSVSPATNFTNCSTLMTIHHPGPVQQGKSGRLTKRTQSHPSQRS